MRTFREIEETARDVPAFSNGSQGYGWMYNWCDRCIHDEDSDTPRPENNGVAGCPIIAVTMLSKTPLEFLADDDRAEILGDYRCIEFRERHEGGGDEPGEPEPGPAVEIDGQEELLPREPFVGTRMFGDVTAPQIPATSSVFALCGDH